MAGSETSYSRIINVSSCTHILGKINFSDINLKNFYIPGQGYAQSKLGQILFTNYLNNLLVNKEKECVQVHSVHPGISNTEIFKDNWWSTYIPWLISIVFKTPQKAALPIIHACLSSDLEGKGGTYIMDCMVFSSSKQSQDTELQKRFFEFSKGLVNIDIFSRFA